MILLKRIGKISFIVTLLFFFSITGKILAQADTIYSDENNKLISKVEFNRKMNSEVFHGLRYETDTIVLNKLRFNYYFGELDPIVKTQLFKLLNKRHQIDTTKTLIIHYLDTLKSIEEFPKVTKTVLLDSLNNEIKVPEFKNSYIDFRPLENVKSHMHLQSYKSFVNEYKKCIRKHKKYRKTARLLHFYGHSSGGLEEKSEDVNWLKDYGFVVKKVFSDGFKTFNTIILHPNGEFYMQSRHNKIPFEHLVKQIHWNEYKTEFNNTIGNI